MWLSSGRTRTCNKTSHTANSSVPRLKRTTLGTSLWPEASLLTNNKSVTREMQALAGPPHQGPLTHRLKTERPAVIGKLWHLPTTFFLALGPQTLNCLGSFVSKMLDKWGSKSEGPSQWTSKHIKRSWGKLSSSTCSYDEALRLSGSLYFTARACISSFFLQTLKSSFVSEPNSAFYWHWQEDPGWGLTPKGR